MEIEQKKVRKILSRKIQQLNDIIADLDTLVTEMGSDFYRVSIFGSARIKEDSDDYKQAFDLAFQLAMRGADIVTGGGPGLMEAANRGAQKASKSRSFGLAIELPFEADANSHLDVKYHHQKFSSRLDEFMRMSHAVIITDGGIGTLLELFYTWQLLQVSHIAPMPVFLLGDMWQGLLEWLEKEPLKKKLLDKSDLERLVIVKSVPEVIKLLEPSIKDFYEAKGSTPSL